MLGRVFIVLIFLSQFWGIIQEEMEDLSGEEDFKVYKDETESEGDLEGECDEGEDGVGRLERGKRKVDRLGAVSFTISTFKFSFFWRLKSFLV